MDIVEVVRKLMSVDTKSIILYRLFIDSEISISLKKRLNDLLEDTPELTDMVIALVIYPALVWNLKGKEINSVMERISEANTEVRALEDTQELLVKASGIQPKLLLEKREAYFSACETLVNLIEDGIEKIQSFPGDGETYYSILRSIVGKQEGPFLSRFIIDKNYRKAISILHDLCANDLTGLLDVILDGYVVDDEELMLVYHNTALLLKEYNRILWYARTSDDKAMRLLSCGSEAEMIALTESDDKFCQAYLIAEYAKLITGAVELVKEFPVYGKEYYSILSGILEATPQKVKDETLAKKIGMSTYTYSVKKKRALSVLGCALWGCDSDTFIRLLTAKA